MRRLLPLLFVLWASGEAQAARLLIVQQNGTATSTNVNAQMTELGVLQSVCDLLGVEYDVVTQRAVAGRFDNPPQHIGQMALRTGLVYSANGAYSRKYGAIWHLGWWCNANNPPRVPGYSPDTLLQRAYWPNIPQIFSGPNRVVGGSIFQQSATCSSSVHSTNGLSATPSWANGMSAYMVGQPYVWKSSTDGSIYYRNTAATALVLGGNSGSVITKARVVAAASAAARSANLVSADQFCADCDSVGRAANYFTGADTAIVYTRQRHISPTPDTAQLIFVPLTYAGQRTVTTNGTYMAIALAIADSLLKDKLIGQRPGWTPASMSFVVDGAFTRSRSDANSGEWDSHGTQLATVNDSAFVKASIDSLNALDIPIVIGVNTDSMEARAYEKVWWAKLKKARFYPSLRTGAGITAAVNGGATGRMLQVDAFGRYRTRDLITADRLINGTPCDGIDTTVSCLLAYARARLDSVPEFKGRLSTTIVAPNLDYIPFARTRNSIPPKDSLAAALLRSGFNTAVGGVQFLGDRPSMSWALTSGGFANPGSSDPRGYSAQIERWPLCEAAGLGSFNWLTARVIDENSINNFTYTTHGITMECMNGFWGPLWYVSDLLHYVHNFKTRLNCVIIRPGDLGFRTSGTENVWRPGWYMVKGITNQIRAVNAFAGRTVVNITYPENVSP